jgi:flavin reductase (DIM6/NTAB) family NADH-FMN oxidoreductase RutF
MDSQAEGHDAPRQRPVRLSVNSPIWTSFFTVAPLVLVGTVEPDGKAHDLAPKHMAMPLGWSNHFCFVCSPRHATQRNAQRTGEFTVSFPRPEQIVETSFAAGPREPDGEKPSLEAVPVFAASEVDGVLVRDAHLWLECRLEQVVEGFGDNTLIIGEVVAAAVDERSMRIYEGDDAELLVDSPLLAYLSPGRFASIDRSRSFPFHTDFRL